MKAASNLKVARCRLVLICVLSLCFSPAKAQELLISEEEMGAIYVSVSASPLALGLGAQNNLLIAYKDMEITPRRAPVFKAVNYEGSYSWCDEDGYGPGTCTGQGCRSVSYECRDAPTPENSLGTVKAFADGNGEQLQLQLDDRVVGYAYFEIDSIQLGPACYEGPSLRSFYFSGVSVRVTGTVEISIRK